MSILGDLAISAEAAKPLTSIINKNCKPVGGIYRLDYHSAVVLTDDFKKAEAGGVPQAGFLLAAAGRSVEKTFILEDQELILLRVRGTAPLPNEAELVQTRLAVVRDADVSGQGFDEVTDVLTRNELQQSAFDCEVLGTFYTREDKRDSPVLFGADVDNVMASAKYQVFLPSPEVLSWLASYPTTAGASNSLAIGHVRFSATQRKAHLAKMDTATVWVDVADFVGRKTAVFGMTRTGKSNTIKTLVTSVHRYASESQVAVGQLIFDPQGEYANINQQDGTGLRLLGDDDSTVRIYKVKPGTDPREKDLRFNFYDLDVIDAVWSLVSDAVVDVTTNYGKSFRSANLEQPDSADRSAHARWEWTLVGFYALLNKCGYAGTGFAKAAHLHVAMSDADAGAINAAHPGTLTGAKGHYRVASPAACATVAEWVTANPDNFPKWFDTDCHFKDVYNVVNFTGITSSIKSIRDFHSPANAGDIGEQLWEDMVAGRLSIVDLSAGNETVAKVMSERVVTHLLNNASSRFREGKDPVRLQVVVEEAHNLFERNARSVADDPWVRLSKEAAKYAMGLIYATQEVTSVDKRILSNTSNWMIAHLNSDHETRELAHYYDFSVWAPSLMRVEDVGFVRMKTYSGKYVVPLQVAKFDHRMVNEARLAAGLEAFHFAEETGGEDAVSE